MADNTIDTLELQINSNSSRAAKSLDNLAKKLYSLNNAFKSVDNGGLRNYSREIGKVSASIKSLNGIRMSVPNLSGLTKQLTNLSNINFAALNGSGSSLKDLASGLSAISGFQNISVPKVDTKNINSITKAIERMEKIDSSKAQPVVDGVQKVAHAMSVLNTVDFNGSKVIPGINAIRRLMDVKTADFDTGALDRIANSMKTFSGLPDISSSTNRFVSSLQKLISAGGKMQQVNSSLPELGRQLKKTIKTLSKIGDISESTNLFVQSIGRLASAGSKTGQTAGQLQILAKEVEKFFKVMESAPKISENTIRMTEALAQLANAGGKVNTATNSISSAFSKLSSGTSKLGNIVNKTASKIGGGIRTIIGWFQKLGRSSSGLKTASLNLGNLLKTAVGFKAIQGLVNLGKSAIDFGSDITEVENVVDVAFGSMSDIAYNFASTAKEQFGLSELAAKTYSGTMMAMLKSSGVAQNAASDMSITLAGLAGDMASFFNLDTDVAFQKIRAGISGEIEPLRQLGINLSVANMEAYALSKGITTSYNAMSQAEKVALRYNYLMSVTGDVQGDFARTSGSWANQVRLLTLNFQSLSAVIGQGLIAGILPAIQALNALMAKLMQAANAFRNFMYVLMGKKLEGSQSGISDITSDLSGIETAGDDIASGLDDATSSATKLKKALSVLPFDQLNQLTDNSSDSGTSTKGLGGSLGNLVDDFTGIQSSIDDLLNKDETPISKWAEKIRKAFLDKDWAGLGFAIADMLNTGMQKIYDVINWDNVGPKITEFVNAFTTAFNSMIEGIDFELLGRLLGAGLNTVVNTLNLLLGEGGIDFGLIGSKIGDALIGSIEEIDWGNLGEMLGNWFMASWRMLSGFVERMSQEDGAGVTGWDKLGKALAEALNGVVKKISLEDIAHALAGLLNGAFDSLASFTKNFNWDDLSENIKNGITTFLQETDFKGNGQKLGDFILHLCEALKKALTKDTFYDFGEKVGEFLGELPWGEMLSTAAELVIGGLSSAFSGLVSGIKENHPLAGSIIDVIGKAFGVIKILQISGIGELAWKLVEHIGEKIVAEKSATLIADKLADLLGGGTGAATEAIEGVGKVAEVASSGGLSTFASTLGKIFGTAGIVFVATGLTVKLAKGIAGITEAAQGGNGILSQTGGYLHDYTGAMEDAHKITQDQAKELWKLIEADESAGKSNSEMYADFIKYLKDYGVSADTARQILENYGAQAGVSADFVQELSDKVGVLGEGMSQTDGKIDTSKIKISDLKDVLYQLSLKSDDFSGSYKTVRDQLDDSKGTLSNSKQAFDLIYNSLKDMGVPLDEFDEMLKTEFPDAVTEMESTSKIAFDNTAKAAESAMGGVTTAVANASSSVSNNAKTGFGIANTAIGAAMLGIQNSTKNAMSSAQSNVKTATDRISSDSQTNWGLASDFATGALGEIDQETYNTMQKVYGVIRRWNEAIEDSFDQNWVLGKDKAISALVELRSTTENEVSSISNVFDSIKGKLENSFSGLYAIGRNAMLSFKNGIESVHINTPHLTMDYVNWQQGNTHKWRWNSSVKWYAKGGLFDTASVIGIGEKGKEAALPLENRRTMKAIADSIVSSSGGTMGLSKEELTQAVAQGVAMAMSMNGGNNAPQYIMNSITLDGSEIAKAVSKAQREQNSRFQPSPAY